MRRICVLWHCQHLKYISELAGDSDDVILFCVLNLPRIQWPAHDEVPGVYLATNVGDHEMETIDEIASAGLHQLSGAVNSFGYRLETVFCSKYDYVEVLSPAPALFRQFGYSSTGKPVELSLAAAGSPSPTPTSPDPNIVDFKRVNYKNLMEDVQNIAWDSVLLPENVNEKIERFYATLHKLFDRHVPKRKPCRRWSKPWISPALRDCASSSTTNGSITTSQPE